MSSALGVGSLLAGASDGEGGGGEAGGSERGCEAGREEQLLELCIDGATDRVPISAGTGGGTDGLLRVLSFGRAVLAGFGCAIGTTPLETNCKRLLLGQNVS